MTRDMSLTLLLMAGSIAAAVAAPDLGTGSKPDDCVELRAVSSQAWSAAPFAASARHVMPVAATPTDALTTVPCGPDASEPYRMWHHGSMKLVPGCGAATST